MQVLFVELTEQILFLLIKQKKYVKVWGQILKVMEAVA